MQCGSVNSCLSLLPPGLLRLDGSQTNPEGDLLGDSRSVKLATHHNGSASAFLSQPIYNVRFRLQSFLLKYPGQHLTKYLVTLRCSSVTYKINQHMAWSWSNKTILQNEVLPSLRLKTFPLLCEWIFFSTQFAVLKDTRFINTKSPSPKDEK